MKNFLLIGAAGYVAPRHIKAIYETGNRILAIYDPHDSVGILDSYDHEIEYFREFEGFDRYCDRLVRNSTKIDYVSICSPNYLHDAHIRFALRIGADVICEKPLVLNPWSLDELEMIEEETGGKVFSILQLRLHPILKKIIKENLNSIKKHKVQVTYSSPRGKWYHSSWKGDEIKSGGIITNIGVHIFDLLMHLFGEPNKWSVFGSVKESSTGRFFTDTSEIDWFLSTSPCNERQRTIIIDSKNKYDLSDGFEDLHTVSYNEILYSNGFRINDVRKSIEFVSNMR